MKTLYHILFVMAMLVVVWSCDEDNMDPVGEWTLSDPALSTPEDNASIQLNEDEPLDEIAFTWEEAITSADYEVTYEVKLVAGDDAETVYLETDSDDNGESTTASITYQEIDQALSAAGYDVSAVVSANWVVEANCLDRTTSASRAVTLTRFSTEALPTQLFLSGDATEAGTDASEAIQMRALKDEDGDLTYIFELYTQLEAGATFMFYNNASDNAIKYGGSSNSIEKNGDGITVDETATYLVTANFNTETYTLLKIEKWSIVGNIINNGWSGDEALEYQGGSVWSKSLTLVAQDDEDTRFNFRANGNWSYVMKRVEDTESEVYMESQSSDAGLTLEDIPVETMGTYVVTLDLSGDPYTYSLEVDDSDVAPTTTPESLYLISEGSVIATLVKDGDTFTSDGFIALQAASTYTLNSASDGTGTSYYLSDAIGTSDSPDDDAVSASVSLYEGSKSEVTVARDQAFQLTIDFSATTATWKFYNMKMFHWSDWDSRDELSMTYQHPNTFVLTEELSAGYTTKFYSPWDVELGSTSPSSLSGDLSADNGSDISCLSESGTYTVTITVASDYASGTYAYVKN